MPLPEETGGVHKPKLRMKLPANFTINQQKKLMVRRGMDANPAPVQEPTQLLVGLLDTQASEGAVK